MDTNTQRTESRIPPPEPGRQVHACMVFANEHALVEKLATYVGGALWSGEGAVVVATLPHLDELEARLRQSGLDVAHFRNNDRYVARSAEAMLSEFMVEGWPDERRFESVASEVLDRARIKGPRVRIYGEMVDILWREGRYDAALRLEELWNRLLEVERLPLLCGYSRAGFESAGRERLARLEHLHSVFLRE